MATTNATIRQSVHESILELIAEFQHAPYTFLFESDLQATLFTKLRSSLSEHVVVRGSGRPRDQYEVSIVHTEYGGRIDVACIDFEEAPRVEQRLHAGSDVHIYELPLLVGIELKYRKMGDRFGLTACLSDLDKLSRLKVRCPLVLGFVQSPSDAEAFLSDNPSGCRYVKVSDTDALARVNVISPESRWSIDVRNPV